MMDKYTLQNRYTKFLLLTGAGVAISGALYKYG